MEYNFKVGDKVFLRSNEPDQPLIVGHIRRFENWGGKLSNPFPVVLDDNAQEWFGGCICEYSIDKLMILGELQAIEQWNFLVKDVPGNQIPEKYGVKYKTFAPHP